MCLTAGTAPLGDDSHMAMTCKSPLLTPTLSPTPHSNPFHVGFVFSFFVPPAFRWLTGVACSNSEADSAHSVLGRQTRAPHSEARPWLTVLIEATVASR